MRVELGALACAGIRAHMGGDTIGAVEKAVFLYTSRLKAGRPVLDLPPFLNGSNVYEPELLVDVEFGAEVEEQLRLEAASQGRPVEKLVAHAVLAYLAERDFLEQLDAEEN